MSHEQDHEYMHAHGIPHEHDAEHAHEYGGEHGHAHAHGHDGGHVHEHAHTHDHEHLHADGTAHSHPHEHVHSHEHSHPHDHEHAHGCPGAANCGKDCNGCDVDPKAELIALMQYMVNHNAAHANELAQLAGRLKEMGDPVGCEQVMQAVSDFEKGNMRLSTVLASMK